MKASVWSDRFGTLFADKIRCQRSNYLQQLTQWKWHLDEVFIKTNDETHYMWRTVDHEDEVLEAYVTKKRSQTAALKFLKKTMKRYSSSQKIVTDRLKSYGAAMKDIGNK